MRTMRGLFFSTALLAAVTPAMNASAFVIPPPPPAAAGGSSFGLAGYAAVGIIVVAGGLALFHPDKGLFPRLLKGTLKCQNGDERDHCAVFVRQNRSR